MGNAQSNEAPRKSRTSQRLSKPKTGNHATAGLLSPGSFSARSRRKSSAPLPNPPVPSPTVASTPTTTSAVEVSCGLDQQVDSGTSLHSAPGLHPESKRRSMFRSRSSRDVADLQQDRVGPSSRLLDRSARTGSMTYGSAFACYGQAGPDNRLVNSESRTSLNYNLTSYEAKRLLNVDEKAGFEQVATTSENQMAVGKENSWMNPNTACPFSAPISRVSSDVSLYMPVRRRSIIQTPGVATRSISPRDLPQLPQLNFRHSHPPTPSLSRQQSGESYRSGIMSIPPRVQDAESGPRVDTPCEDNYLSIGAFKLGSLRITNGSPSPVTPGIDGNRGNDGSGAGNVISEDGYFSGKLDDETGLTTSPATQLPAQCPGLPSETIRCRSTSPPIQPQPISPELQTTSKVTAQEDELFDDETQPEYSSVEVLDVRLDPNAKPSHQQVECDVGSSITRTDSGFVSTTSPSSEVPHKSLSKADSGYSSNVSLRSVQAKVQTSEKQLVSTSLEKQLSQSAGQKSAPVGLESHGAEGTAMLYPEKFERESDSPPPPVPPKDAARSRPKPDVVARKTIPMQGLAEDNEAKTPRTKKQVPNPGTVITSSDRDSLPPEIVVQSPRSVKSSTSDNSSPAQSIGGGSQKSGRLQRLLSGGRRPTNGLPPANATHSVQHGGIPPVPRKTEHKIREHPGRLPTAARRLALNSRSSMDTLKTILSVGSMEASVDAAHPLQTAPAMQEPENKDGIWKQTLHSVPTSLANVAAYVIPRKSTSRKPVPTCEEVARESGREASNGRGCDIRDAVPTSPVVASGPARPKQSRDRTRSLTFVEEQGLKAKRRVSEFHLTRSSIDLPSPPLPSPVAKALAMESRVFQSVNRKSRGPQPLRVPPPLRSQSSASSLSRKASRESIQGHPAIHTLPSKASVESLPSHSSSRPGLGGGLVHSRTPSAVSMDPRRLLSFRQYHNPQSPPCSFLDSDAQRDDSMAGHASRISVTGGSRRTSIDSIRSEGGYRQAWHVRQQPLRHRASYDSYSYQSQLTQYGYPPSMSNGYTPPVRPAHGLQSKAAATWSKSQVDAAAGQWYQGELYQPSVPRGHYRHRSTGNWNGYGSNPPYRVLHSYNSPAYRNAPIWG
ncbi:hypothetical protein C8A03DRAFT_19782 [Achaetomium macrosporum]|uniref:Proteophosphoglycan ppg4 n=1 Tax=Achaetomium macrosporum TaxID=79813 RepID=A0AAN7C0P8_9PEZI|nr:hypothetical protein C8A03DRAFT_19782 [Achaetomium macrosporum]